MHNSNWEFHALWGQKKDQWMPGVRALWLKHASLTEDEIQKRFNQLVMLVTHNGEVVAVSTAYKMRYPPLNNHLFYALRYFVHPEFRVAGLDITLIRKAVDLLESSIAQDKVNTPIGILAVGENPLINNSTAARKAIWRFVPFVFIGNTENNLPVRVYYFKDSYI